MRDIIFITMAIAFFATAGGYVRACGRIIGAEQIASGEEAEPQGLRRIADDVPAR